LLVGFCLLLIALKTTYKSKEGGWSKPKKKSTKHRNYKLQTLQNKVKNQN